MSDDKLRDILHAVWLNGRSGREGMSVEEGLNAIAALNRPTPKPQPITVSEINTMRQGMGVTDISKIPTITVEPQIRPGMGAF